MDGELSVTVSSLYHKHYRHSRHILQIQYTPSHPLSVRSILILSSPLGHFAQSWPVPMGKSAKWLNELLPSEVTANVRSDQRSRSCLLTLAVRSGACNMQHAIRNHIVRHPRCVFINYNWINQLSNTTIWWLDICCLLHRYQLHVSALMYINGKYS